MKRVIVPLAQSGSGLGGESYIIESYLAKLNGRGVVPLLVPAAVNPEIRVELMKGGQGVLLMGGADVEPSLYGAPRHAETVPGPRARDDFEIELARDAVSRDIPILAVCRGVQVLNVALGGTLIQHVPDVTTTEHRFVGASGYTDALNSCNHPVELEPDSLVSRILGTRSVTLNSAHHQALDRLGTGLRVAGRAPDGIIEFVEHAELTFCIGCQAHPEAMEGVTDRLFDAFVGAL
jgi:putative glutamine amidotransferase